VSVLAFLMTAVVMPLLVTEFAAWLPWLASRMIRGAARALPRSQRARYLAEWQAELEALPGGNLTQLLFAIRICMGALDTGAQLRDGAPTPHLSIKLVFDRLTAAAALLVLMPVMIMVSMAIRLGDGGPVFVRRAAIGREGRAVAIYKFRTVALIASPQTWRNDGSQRMIPNGGPQFTRVGGWLRRYSLDELPQLINVLRGDMSLVGPSAMCPAETRMWHGQIARLDVRPGMTGLWQVIGRNLRRGERVRLDMRYVENWSFLLDLQILWRVIGNVLRGRGRR
jgi:lipopolysaccharide/colanic/teichoic acid biosynthesis glycosyltransferase